MFFFVTPFREKWKSTFVHSHKNMSILYIFSTTIAGKNLQNNFQKSSKIGRDQKTLISVFAWFLTTSIKVLFLKGTVDSPPPIFYIFPIFLNFLISKVLRQLATRLEKQLVHNVFCARYHVPPLYLWRIITTLKSWNVS